MRLILSLVLFICLGAQAGAQSLPQINPGDGENGLREVASGVEAHTWRAVGRLDTGASFCSATLIAPNLVLTAAHCLFHPETGRQFSPDEFTFLAGLMNGRAEAVRQVRRTFMTAGYRPDQGPDFDMIGLDLALLELRQPVSVTSVIPIPAREVQARFGDVTVVSYGADRENYASIEEDCRILQAQGTVRALSCSAVSGASGSPVMRVNQGHAEVIAVMSAGGHADGEPISLAVALEGQLSGLMDQYVTGGVESATFATTSRATSFITPSQNARDGIGARFIRP